MLVILVTIQVVIVKDGNEKWIALNVDMILEKDIFTKKSHGLTNIIGGLENKDSKEQEFNIVEGWNESEV